MNHNTARTEHSIVFGEYEPVFSCEMIQGVSFSEYESIYIQLLKDSYEYKPELYDHELFDSEFRIIDY